MFFLIIMKCNLFHYLKSGVAMSQNMKLRFVQDIGRLDCYRAGFCECLKHFEQKGFKVKVVEMNKNVDMIVIEKKN